MEQRLEFVLGWAKHERSMAELCRVFGISRQTGYELVAQYQAEGLAGLKLHSRAPRHHPTDAKDPNSVIDVYASASRRSTRVLEPGGDEKSDSDGQNSRGQWVQVSRLGEPLINEVLIPLGQKDRWNARDPRNDRQFEQFYLNPEPAKLINLLYNEPPVVPIDTTNRSDLVTILLTSVPGLNYTGPQKEDLLRLNMAIAPSEHPDPLGVLAGDLAGFPNGRCPTMWSTSK